MTTAIALTALAHLTALACVLAVARWDSVLVDEQGLPLGPDRRTPSADWQEATIPVAVEVELPR